MKKIACIYFLLVYNIYAISGATAERAGCPALSFVKGGVGVDNGKLGEIYDEMRRCIELEGYNCAGFELVSESGMNILRAYIDMPGGVDLQDCETVARVVTEYLDTVESALPDRYYLEVSSLGLERPLFCLQDYEAQLGKLIAVNLKNGKKLEVTLSEIVGEDIVVIDKSGEKRTIAFEDVRKANLVYVEEAGQKKTFKKTGKKKK